MPVSLKVTVKVYHCANGDEPFDGQIRFRAYSVHQCKFDNDCYGDGDGDGTCRRTFIVPVNVVYSAIHKAAVRAIPSFAWYNSCGTEKNPLNRECWNGLWGGFLPAEGSPAAL